MKNYFLSYLFIIICITGVSQTDSVPEQRAYYTYEVINGDTLRVYTLSEFKYKDPDWEKQWQETVFFTTRVYPYAIILDSIITAHDAKIAELEKQKNSKKKIRKHNKKLRNQLKEEYGLEIKNMSVQRGKYLAKLTHKENGSTIYELIKKHKSGANAFWWQMVMKIYGGANLKTKYSAQKDWMLNLVLKEIEAGTIKVIPRDQQKKALIKYLEDKKKKKK